MRCLAPIFLALGVSPVMAQDPAGTEWQLLAIDGAVFEAEASLRIGEDGTLSGKAPCNSWSAANLASLPALKLSGIRSTRMACDRLDQEQAFFDALSVMTGLLLDPDRTLILTGPEGRTMEFVADRADSLTMCKTCAPKG